MSTSNVIAIDGTAYSGKSHIAKGLSQLTGFEYINTGHMFRALAHWAKKKNISLEDEQALLQMPFDISFRNGRTWVAENPKQTGTWTDWTLELEDAEIVQNASRIAVYPGVRKKLADMQRAYAQKDFIIMEGRDIGTTVFPDALCRIYVTADLEVRAKRLYKTLSKSEKRAHPPSDEYIGKLRDEKLTPIDQLDANRKVSPLISKEAAEKLGYYIHNSPESYTVEDDVRDIYEKYVRKQLEKVKK
jgi:cytidylate kinase